MKPLFNRLINDYFFSMPSLVVHTIWFVAWFYYGLSVDLLTNVVSLEAIYLTIFVGLAQRDQHETTREHITKHHKGK